MAVDIPGLIALLAFYSVIMAIGVWAARKAKKVERTCKGSRSEVTIVGGRNINVLVGVFTMAATWVGGGYILGTAEAVYSPARGLVWAVGPPAYFINLFVGGLFFAKPMRSKRFVTMLDPFQIRYGGAFTTAMLIPASICDILWVSCSLAALGGTMSVILGLPSWISIIISAAVSIAYTLLGGLYSVAYTDIVQLCFMFVSLWLSVPFIALNPAVTDVAQTSYFNQTNEMSWLGELKLADAGKWMDEMLLLAFGGLAYQALHQRILSAASSAQAQITCFAAAAVVFILGIPSVIIGAMATSADWNQTAYSLPPPYERGDAGKILPLTLHFFTPSAVSAIGIGSLAAAVMSSVDSVLLSSASMFTQNIYKKILRKQASEKELQHVIHASLVVVGAVGTGLAFLEDSVFALWLISGDLIYCLILPQLISVLHFDCSNKYGAISGYILGLLLRLLSGEPMLGIPPLSGVVTQLFPFRTTIMLVSLACIPAVSYLTRWLFSSHMLPPSWDVLRVFSSRKETEEGEEDYATKL